MELNASAWQLLNNNNLLAQVQEAEPLTWLPVALAVLVLLIIIVAVFVARKRAADEKLEPQRRAAPREKSAIPTADLLEDREEVEEEVEIHEGMSLAEIKKAKRAKVVGKDQRRETAAEATERSVAEQAGEGAEEAEEAEEQEEIEEPKGLGEESSITIPSPKERPKREPGERSEQPTMKLPRPKSKLPRPEAEEEVEEEVEEETAAAPEEAEVEEKKEVEEKIEAEEKEEEAKSLRDGLEKTRTGFIDRLGSLFRGDELDEDMIEAVEEILFTADIGAKIAQDILGTVEEQLSADQKGDPEEVWGFIRTYCEEILRKHEDPIDYDRTNPFVMLVIGVNGVGKTTTIGKLASQLTREGKSVMLVAGDTFRAAAVDQLEIWAKRTGIPMHRGEDKADPSSVIFGGIEKGMAEGADVIICDTAGRLHTKSNLLDELSKMARVSGKAVEGAPHETVLVLDANTGQNAIAQAKLFNEALDITGVVLTKLDGTAKGGVILGICDELKAPVRYIGIGEGIRDLRRFDAEEFVEALFM